MHSDEPEQMRRKTSVGAQKESQDDLRGSQEASHGPQDVLQGPQATLEYISDSCEDEGLDEKISETLDEMLDELTAREILDVVIDLCPQLQATRGQLSGSLKAYPQLRKLAWKAANSRNFKDIRRLVIFQKPGTVQPPLLDKQRELSILQVAAVENAWTGTYIKGGEQLLLKTITDMNTDRGRDAYDNSLAIVQSSGTGKSRTVHELAKYVFTIPLNIRPEDENAAYPRPDRILRDYLLGEGIHDKTQNQLQTRFLAFFAHLFICIVQEFQTKGFIDCLAQASVDRSPSEIVAQAWFEHLQAGRGEDTNRTKLYKKVVHCCKSSVFPIEDTSKPVDVDVEVGTSKAGGKQRGKPGSPPAPLTPKHPADSLIEKEKERLHEVKRWAKGKLDELIRRIEELASQTSGKTTYKEAQGASKETRPARVVMYVDEAHSMTCKRAPELIGRSYYNEFVSASNSFTKSDIFFLYLSTSSSLNEFAPPRQLHPSARVNKAEGKDTIQAPFTELPFDCLAGHEGFTLLSIANNRTASSKTLSEISTLRFMSQFGRPLFGTFLKALVGPDEDEVDDAVFTDIIRLARTKLLCRNDPEDISQYESPTSYLALFGVRIFLQYSMGREHGRKKILKLVESHMAIAYSVPQHRETIAMGYPSEPVLAEAAAQHFHYLRNSTTPFGLARTLLDLVNRGYVDKGERGELVARLLFMLAYDDAIVNHQKGAHNLNFSKGVPMEEFIRALFTHDYAEAILKSVPDNVADGKTFKEAFKDVWIRFTHFGLAEDADFVDATAMCLAFARCMGVRFHSQQERVDLGIPGFHRYTKNENGQVEEQHLCEQFITAMWVQIKNHVQAVSTAKTAFTAEDLHLFPEGSPSRAYIVVIMNLGADKGCRVKVNGEGVKRSPRSAPVHPRYTIHAYGCSSKVYKVVAEADEDVFRLLLAPSNIVTAHPRQTDESLYAVKKLKPYWKKDAARCDWASGWER